MKATGAGGGVERIAKWLGRAGVASRRDAERMITDGLVRLNHVPVTHPATFVSSGDIVEVGGRLIEGPDRTRLWRYHKPDGLVTTHRDPEGRATIFDRMPDAMPRVVTVGRLDLNSEGLLLLTNDGELKRQLELPSNEWVRRYRTRVWGVADNATLDRLHEGVVLDGRRTGPIEAGIDSIRGENAWLTISLREGRYREVRRVLASIELTVTRLIRVAYGPFQLGRLRPGEIEEVPGKVLREQIPAGPTPSRAPRGRTGT